MKRSESQFYSLEWFLWKNACTPYHVECVVVHYVCLCEGEKDQLFTDKLQHKLPKHVSRLQNLTKPLTFKDKKKQNQIKSNHRK